MSEAKLRLKREKVVPLKSTTLEEIIYVVKDNNALEKAPAGSVSYLLEEIDLLRGVTPEELKLIHSVKKVFGGRVVNNASLED
ncbi:MAG: hypothetical protein QXI12_09035 [Candidatus Methanomethyliaceae archaeon]